MTWSTTSNSIKKYESFIMITWTIWTHNLATKSTSCVTIWSRWLWNHLSGSTNILCPNHKSGTLSIYVDWIHMLKTNPYSRHIQIASLKIWLMIHYYTPRKVWNLKVPSNVLKMVPPKRMTTKIDMILSTSLGPSDEGCRNAYLPIYYLFFYSFIIFI